MSMVERTPKRGDKVCWTEDGVVHRVEWVAVNGSYLLVCDPSSWMRPLELVYVVNTAVTCMACLADDHLFTWEGVDDDHGDP